MPEDRIGRRSLFSAASARVVALILMTAFCVIATARMEYLNAQAGYVLPREMAGSIRAREGGSGAWRAARYGGDANSMLRDHAINLGCWQYIVAIAGIGLAYAIVVPCRSMHGLEDRRIAIVSAALCLVTFAITLYRGPFRALID